MNRGIAGDRPPGFSAEIARSRVYGTFFFIGFGTIWSLTGLASLHRLGAVTAAGVLALAAASLVAGFALLRRADRLPNSALTPAEQARQGRAFTIVNIVQWIAVAVAVTVLVLARHPQYIVPAIGAIVGLHLFPLAGLFRYPLHYLTGSVLVAWCLGCIVALPKERIPGIGAFGTGAILLGSAALTLIVTAAKARNTLANSSVQFGK